MPGNTQGNKLNETFCCLSTNCIKSHVNPQELIMYCFSLGVRMFRLLFQFYELYAWLMYEVIRKSFRFYFQWLHKMRVCQNSFLVVLRMTAMRTTQNNRFRLAKQQLCTCITLFCTFLFRRCTITT